MCQPYPLGRCVNGAQTEFLRALNEKMDASDHQRETKKEYEAGAEKYRNFFDSAEGDEPELEQFWNDAEAAMNKMSAANMRLLNADRQLQQKQILVDSTDTGFKQLNDKPDSPEKTLRLQNAVSQREWTKRIRQSVKEEADKPGSSKASLSSYKFVLYSRMLQEEHANYDASQELERRYSASATSLTEEIQKMEGQELKNKDEQIEVLAKVRNQDSARAKQYSSEMAMFSARITDLSKALEEIG